MSSNVKRKNVSIILTLERNLNSIKKIGNHWGFAQNWSFAKLQFESKLVTLRLREIPGSAYTDLGL
tara:strand:+ start:1026 stop:1223 length:198 start_codon:yes stop_codon:yes gene_type:complete